MCGSKVYNFSRGGMTARTYCNSFADEMDYWNPKYASQAYIIALGVNDIGYEKGEVGSTKDIDLNDWHNNTRNFAGYMGEIMQRLREIQPRAKFFLLTMPRENEGDEMRQRKEDHRRFLYELAELFGNTYVIDLFRDAPVYDEAFKKQYYLRGHMNPMGYLQTAKTRHISTISSAKIRTISVRWASSAPTCTADPLWKQTIKPFRFPSLKPSPTHCRLLRMRDTKPLSWADACVMPS